jgi:ankyrin repeat protein
MNKLPNEILQIIIEYVGIQHFHKLIQVNKKCKNIIDNVIIPKQNFTVDLCIIHSYYYYFGKFYKDQPDVLSCKRIGKLEDLDKVLKVEKKFYYDELTEITDDIIFNKFFGITDKVVNIDELMLEMSIEGKLDVVKYLITKGANIRYNDDVIFHKAIYNNNVDIMRFCLEKGVDYHMKDNYPLMTSVRSNNLEMVKLLIEYGADPHVDENINFYVSIGRGHVDIFKYFLELGFDVCANGNYAIQVATKNDNFEIIKLLINKGADIHTDCDTLFINCAQSGCIEAAKLFLNLGVKIDINDNAAIIEASKTGRYNHMKMVKFLLENGANPRARNDTPLVEAAHKGHLELVKLFHSLGADLRVNNDLPFYRACEWRRMDVMKYLLDHGADVNTMDGHAMCLYDNYNTPDFIEFLLDYGADIHTKYDKLLFNSVYHQHFYPIDSKYSNECDFKKIDFIIEKGANLQNAFIQASYDDTIYGTYEIFMNNANKYLNSRKPGTDANKYFALMIASMNGDSDKVKFLLENKEPYYDINCALVVAYLKKHLNIAKLLIDFGADVNIYLDLAAENGHLDVDKLLSDLGVEPF